MREKSSLTSGIWLNTDRPSYAPDEHKQLYKTSTSDKASPWSYVRVCSFAQSCPSLCGPKDFSPPGTIHHGDSPRQEFRQKQNLSEIISKHRKKFEQLSHKKKKQCPPTWEDQWLNGKESICQAGDVGSISGTGRSLEKEIATLSSILTWEIPWTEEPVGQQSMESKSQTRFSNYTTTTTSVILVSWQICVTATSLPVITIISLCSFLLLEKIC